MAFEVLLIREGNRLAAADSLSAEILMRIKERETVTASIRRPRNPRHHAKLFSLLNVVFENQTTYATIEQLLGALKLAVGLFDTGLTVDRVPYVVPRSISFASMNQNEFETTYEKMLEVILTKIIPNINRDDVEARVHEILNGRGHG
jgi:hypothetical protein